MGKGNISLLDLCVRGDIEAIIEAVKAGKNPDEYDKRGRTGLHLAASRGRTDILRVLCDHDADVTATDRQGNTPLHYCGHVETINCLLEYGAEPTARNNHGDTPLMLMRRRGVEAHALKIMEEMEYDEVLGVDESSQPLLKKHHLVRLRDKGLKHMRSVWYEFCVELGVERLVIVLLVLLCLSLYVAYMVTGFATQMDTRIPIYDEDVKRMEL